MLPDSYILRGTINVNASQERYQYHLTYSVFGEVLKIELPFLKLPSNAQRLTKGKNTEKYLLRLNYYKELLKFQIPLSILGFWPTEEFLSISVAIKERELELGGDLPDDFLPFINDPWLKDFFLRIKEDIAQKGTGNFWRGLAGLMTNDPVVLETSFRYLRAYSWQLPAALIGHLWPILNGRPVIRHFYQHADLYPSELTKNWLLKELVLEKSTFFRGLILKGLSVYQEETVYQTLVAHYQTQQEMGEGESEMLIGALSAYDTPEVQAIAWKALVGKNYFAAKAAHNVLLKQGVDEKRVAEKLTVFFFDNQFIAGINSLMSRFQQLADDDLLLSSRQFLARAAYAVSRDKNIRLQTNLASLLNRTWEPSTFKTIIEFLYHPDPLIRRLGLDQVSNIFVQFPNRVTIVHPDTIKRIFQLTGDVTEAVRIQAIETIRVLVPRLGQTTWIVALLNVKDRQQLLSHILPAILSLHQRRFTNLAVVPFCTKNLTHKLVSVRRYSILILQYYRLPEVERALKNLPPDTDLVIREALGRGWREDDDLIKILR